MGRSLELPELIAGLRELARDREAFFTGRDDEIFRQDYQVCIQAAELLERLQNQPHVAGLRKP